MNNRLVPRLSSPGRAGPRRSWRGGTAPTPRSPTGHKRLVCSMCGSRAVDFVLTGPRGEVRAGLQTITQG
jgi:hypothetical protein